MGCSGVLGHNIETGDSSPIKQRLRLAHRDEVDQEVKDILAQGLSSLARAQKRLDRRQVINFRQSDFLLDMLMADSETFQGKSTGSKCEIFTIIFVNY